MGTTTCTVRKHRAPKGALRLVALDAGKFVVDLCQKAPSVKRRIKTIERDGSGGSVDLESESTERQKVH